MRLNGKRIALEVSGQSFELIIVLTFVELRLSVLQPDFAFEFFLLVFFVLDLDLAALNFRLLQMLHFLLNFSELHRPAQSFNNVLDFWVTDVVFRLL
jgi:hypothetical protein